jgi:hypothetical protein
MQFGVAEVYVYPPEAFAESIGDSPRSKWSSAIGYFRLLFYYL